MQKNLNLGVKLTVILLVNYILEANTVFFTPLHLFDNSSYNLVLRLMFIT